GICVEQYINTKDENDDYIVLKIQYVKLVKEIEDFIMNIKTDDVFSRNKLGSQKVVNFLEYPFIKGISNRQDIISLFDKNQMKTYVIYMITKLLTKYDNIHKVYDNIPSNIRDFVDNDGLNIIMIIITIITKDFMFEFPNNNTDFNHIDNNGNNVMFYVVRYLNPKTIKN